MFSFKCHIASNLFFLFLFYSCVHWLDWHIEMKWRSISLCAAQGLRTVQQTIRQTTATPTTSATAAAVSIVLLTARVALNRIISFKLLFPAFVGCLFCYIFTQLFAISIQNLGRSIESKCFIFFPLHLKELIYLRFAPKFHRNWNTCATPKFHSRWRRKMKKKCIKNYEFSVFVVV